MWKNEFAESFCTCACVLLAGKKKCTSFSFVDRENVVQAAWKYFSCAVLIQLSSDVFRSLWRRSVDEIIASVPCRHSLE